VYHVFPGIGHVQEKREKRGKTGTGKVSLFTFKTNYLNPFTIKKIDFSNSNEKEKHDMMVEMVDQMLERQKKYHTATIETEKNLFKKQIDILDRQIDQLVYQLYDLTPEEIAIVENAS
jgi:hypothetical protein